MGIAVSCNEVYKELQGYAYADMLALNPNGANARFKQLDDLIFAFRKGETLILDGTEQRIQRPSGYDTQKEFYSGKKKSPGKHLGNKDGERGGARTFRQLYAFLRDVL